MYRYDSLYFVAAVGAVIYILSFLQHRSMGPPDRPLRVPRSLAVLAGSRSTYVDCFAFAVQIAAVSLPIWHFSLNLRPDIELKGNPFVYDPGWIGIGTGFFANYRCKFIAKRRLKSADYLRLGSLYRFKVTAVGNRLIENKTVCRHCGFRELTYDFQTMHIEGEPSGPCLGLSLAYDLLNAILIPRELAVSLRSASVAGCTLSPVGGGEPADWYALHSDHILPQAIFSPRSRKQMPYRTMEFDENHGMEFNSDSQDVDISYRRSSFHPPDVSSSYELFGGKMRQGGRFLVISQKLFRMLIKSDKELLWQCRPVQLVDS